MTADLARALAVLAASALVAVVVHVLLFRLVFRYGWRTQTAHLVRTRLRWPARSLTALMAVLVAQVGVVLDADARDVLVHALTVAIILAAAWLAMRAAHVGADVATARLDVSKPDNMHERRRLTQVRVIRRLTTVVIVVVAAGGVLMTFDTARSIGASVLASAGIVGIMAGVAGRSTLGNLVAGIQIAFAEPISLDDVVIVEGEWGRIEEITLTYVVVALWDQRRLIVPTTFFVEQPFENWTRTQSQLIGSVTIWADWQVDVDQVRDELTRLTDDHPLWDGDVRVLQVVDAATDAVQLRALVTARDAAKAWDLRCDIREGLMAHLHAEQPDALPRTRLVTAANSATKHSSTDASGGRTGSGRHASVEVADLAEHTDGEGRQMRFR